MPPTSTTSSISARLQAGVLERPLARTDGPRDQLLDQALELGAGQLEVEVLRARLVGGDERQVDLGLLGRGQLDLGLLGGFLQPLQGHPVLAQVDAVVLLELVGQVVDQDDVEVLAAEEGVAVGRLDLEHAVADLEDRDVERAAAKVIDGDRLAVLAVEAVGQRRGGRLVDDAQDFEAGDLAGVLGRLALGVVEVGRDGDDRLGDLLAEVGLRRLLHLLQDEGGDLRRRVLLAAALGPGIAVVGLDDLVGHEPLSFCVVGSSYDRPIRRLMAKKVFSGLVTAWRLAAWPTRRSPSSVKATIDGVVRTPSEFSMTFGVAPSMTATQELVVPRSMPMTFDMSSYLSLRQTVPGLRGAPFSSGRLVGPVSVSLERTWELVRRLYRFPSGSLQAIRRKKPAGTHAVLARNDPGGVDCLHG